MHVEEVRQRAKAAGVRGYSRMRKEEMILAIQQEEGHNPCFHAEWAPSCTVPDCCWREDCQH